MKCPKRRALEHPARRRPLTAGQRGFEPECLAPQKHGFATFLSTFLDILAPGMDATRGAYLHDLLSILRLDCQHTKRDECVDASPETVTDVMKASIKMAASPCIL
jgi:hypothetical protein